MRAHRDREGRTGIDRCAYCSEGAEYDLGGLPYCPRCALRYVILAMDAELATGGDPASITAEILVKH